jgi:ankyrin repeat protein
MALENKTAHREHEIIEAAINNFVPRMQQLLRNIDHSEIDAVDEQGRTALMWSSEFGHVSIVTMLTAAGATVTLRDAGGGKTIQGWLAGWLGGWVAGWLGATAAWWWLPE